MKPRACLGSVTADVRRRTWFLKRRGNPPPHVGGYGPEALFKRTLSKP